MNQLEWVARHLIGLLACLPMTPFLKLKEESHNVMSKFSWQHFLSVMEIVVLTHSMLQETST
jgi:hypothetical protein